MASQESVIFQEFYATLLEAIKPEVSVLVADLFSKFLIGETTRDCSGNDRDKAKAVLDDIGSGIKTKPSILQDFLSVLEVSSSLTLSDVAERIRQRLVHRSTSEPTHSNAVMTLPIHEPVSQSKSLPPAHGSRVPSLYTFNVNIMVSPDQSDQAILSTTSTPLAETPLAASQAVNADCLQQSQEAITPTAGPSQNNIAVNIVRNVTVPMPVGVYREQDLIEKGAFPGLFHEQTGRTCTDEEESLKNSELCGPSVIASDSQSKQSKEEIERMHLQPTYPIRNDSIEECPFTSLGSTNSEDLEDIEDKLSRCRIEIDQLQEKKEKAISRKIAKHQWKVDRMKREKSKLESQLNKTEHELDEQIKLCRELQDSLTRQEELSTQLQSQLDQARLDGTELQNKLSSTQKRAAMYHVQMTRTKQEYERLLTERRANDPYYAQLKESEKKRAELEAENNKLREQLREYETKICVLEEEVTILIDGHVFDSSFQLDYKALQSDLDSMPVDESVNGL